MDMEIWRLIRQEAVILCWEKLPVLILGYSSALPEQLQIVY